MTISGGTGIGKTRLIAEVLQRCPGLDTLTLQGEPYASDNPYWAFRDPMRRLLGVARADHFEMTGSLDAAVRRDAPDQAWSLPLLGDVLQIQMPDNEVTETIDPQFRPERTADVMVQLLERIHTGPFAVIVEDGQWLDQASLALLERIGVAAESRPWTVIVTARTETGRFGAVGTSLRLRPLPDETVRQIVIEVTAAAPLRPHELDAVVARSGGNPLFVSEILGVVRETGSVDQLPETLDAVVSTQIDTLPPLTRQILRYSAVLGSSFRRAVLDQILEPEDIEMDDATERGLRRFLDADGPDRLRFKHAVVHDVAYQGLSFRRRRELHARAGSVIEKAAGAEPDDVAEVLATHFSLAADYEKVWRYAPVAADRAKRAYANAEAATQYRRALEAAGHVDLAHSSDLARLWAELGEVQELAGQFEAARDSYSNALRLETEDPLRTVDLYLLRARAWMNSGNTTQAKRNVTLGRKHLATQKSAVRARAVARLDAFEAQVHARKGDPVRAHDCAMAAVESATRAGEEEALARAYRALDWANFMLGRDEARQGEKAIEILQRLGFLERSVGVINNMGAFAYLEGKWDEATDWYRKSVDAAERSGNVSEAALTRANIAEVLIGQRRHEEALDLLHDAKRVFDASRATAITPFVSLQTARAHIGLGNLERGIAELEALVETQVGGSETAWTAETILVLASALVMAGRPDEAWERLESLQSRLPDAAARLGPGILRVRASAMAARGDAEGAEQSLRQALETAVAMGDLYQESLALEDLTAGERRIGTDPDPAITGRLDELRRLLGIRTEQPV
jgi:tetratricopeptide (TPR) repeat protein